METDWIRYGDYIKARFPRDLVDVVLFREFLEQGGDIRPVARTLGFSDRTIHMIDRVMDDDKFENPYLGNGPLLHIQEVLADPALDEETCNYIILVKIGARIDSLNERYDGGRLSAAYAKKSSDLLECLFGQYTGNDEYATILRVRLKEFVAKTWRTHDSRQVE